jgi:hypothetical protein
MAPGGDGGPVSPGGDGDGPVGGAGPRRVVLEWLLVPGTAVVVLGPGDGAGGLQAPRGDGSLGVSCGDGVQALGCSSGPRRWAGAWAVGRVFESGRFLIRPGAGYQTLFPGTI